MAPRELITRRTHAKPPWEQRSQPAERGRSSGHLSPPYSSRMDALQPRCLPTSCRCYFSVVLLVEPLDIDTWPTGRIHADDGKGPTVLRPAHQLFPKFVR